MSQIRLLNVERLAATVCVLFGLAVAAMASPKDSYFVPNFAFLAGPQLTLVAFACLAKLRGAGLAGIALVLALYAAAFSAWAAGRGEAMAWLGYLFTMPGIALGVISAACFVGRRKALLPFAAFLVSVAIVLTAVLASQAVVCSTVIYCLPV